MFRTDHPKPQFMRENWINLNGVWNFAFDSSDSGYDREMYRHPEWFDLKIEVPFCPQSKLSGIGKTDFLPAVWYHRSVDLMPEQLENQVILHFGAVDYEAIVYINGEKCGEHQGGYISWSVNITDFVHPGKNDIIVLARDDERDPMIPCGKQSESYSSYGCYYTRTTGIWQTVWIEFVPRISIESVRFECDIQRPSVTLLLTVKGEGELTAEVSYQGKQMGKISSFLKGGYHSLTVDLSEKHLWEIGCGRLYDVELSFGPDKVRTYFGLREISYENKKFSLNGKTVFQRLVLDQGFYPDGVYTAPSDEDLLGDIRRAVALGFNGARLHQKIFEERFLYHADREGYLVWAEYPNWGLDHTDPRAIYAMQNEWLEEMDRDYNHPSIVGWCPLNETWDRNGKEPSREFIRSIYKMTKAADKTRPCIDTSGGYHEITDIYDVHPYDQDPEAFRRLFVGLEEGTNVHFFGSKQKKYQAGDPFFVSEYGGIRWATDGDGWGYGDAPKTEKEFLTRLKNLTDVLLDNPNIFAFCYTQLTDVEQEQNGLYTYDRVPKFDPEIIRAIFSRQAEIEK